MRTQLRLLRYLWPRWPSLITLLVTMGFGVAVDLARPWPIKLLVDNVLGGKHLSHSIHDVVYSLPGPGGRDQLLFWVVIATVLIFLAANLLAMAGTYASVGLGERMTYDVGADVFAHLQRLSLTYHARRPVGDTIARVTGDPSCVQVFVIGALVPAIQSVVTVITMFVIMLSLQPQLTLLSLVVAPFLILAIRIFSRPMKRRNRLQRDLEGRMMSHVQQTMNAVPVVQVFNREERETTRFREHAGDIVDALQRATFAGMWFHLFVGLVTTVGTAGIMFLGAKYVMNGTMTVGTVLVFLSYLQSLYGPLNSITHTGSTLQYAAAQADRVMEILDSPVEVQDAPDAVDVDMRGHVRYEDVTFGYEGRPVLKHVSLEALPGQVIALVGPTGAGKTTTVNLLVRFFDPWEGRVTIDGRDLRQIKLRSLREQVSIVLQDPFIFPFTIAENIAYGRPDASREEIVAAAKAANAHPFIERLPEGYDTVVGERGATLSGGEKQRLSIARAFLKDAPILILDEPTSALDARTEAMLLEALERLMKGRVTFIIAHRLSTIRHADRILVVEDGEIIEQGDHDELVRRGGLYAGLYNQQMDIALHEGVEPDVDTLVHGKDEARGGPSTTTALEGEAADVPLVSIVLSNYNYGRFVGHAIESALAQTYPRVEVVVVDDGSSDDSREVIGRYQDVVSVFKPNGGQMSAINAGFAACHGAAVCFFDSDDVLEPTAIESAMARMEHGVATVQWPLWEIDAQGSRTGAMKPRDPLDHGDLRAVVLRDGPESYSWSPTCGSLWSRAFLDEVLPLIDERFDHGASTDACLACLAPLFGRIESLDEPQASYRAHGSNTYHGRQGFEEKLERDRRHFDRQCDLLARYCEDRGIAADPDDWRRRSWLHQFPRLRAQILDLIGPDETLVFVDDGQVGAEAAPDRRVVPFTERDGDYWGPPVDDESAIDEIERVLDGRGGWVVIAWTAFWWLEHYQGLDRYLRSSSASVHEDDCMVAFRIDARTADSHAVALTRS